MTPAEHLEKAKHHLWLAQEDCPDDRMLWALINTMEHLIAAVEDMQGERESDLEREAVLDQGRRP